MTRRNHALTKAVNIFTVFSLLVWSFGPLTFTAHGAVSNTNVFPLVSGMDNMAPGGMKPLLALDATATGGEMLANVNLTVRGDNGFQLGTDLATMTNGATSDGGLNLYRDNKAAGQVGMFDQSDTRITLSSVPASGETRFSKITPSGTQLANGVSALTAGDIILSSNQGANPPGYSWHLVTVNGANPGDAALRVDGAAVTFMANSRISKLTPAATVLSNGGTGAGTLTVAKGDLVFGRATGAPNYGWHMATGAGTVLSDDVGENDANLNDNVADPALTATTQVSKIVPAGTATDNGATAGGGNQLVVAVGDVVFVNITGAGYGWHVVTTAGNLSSDTTEQAGVRLDGGSASSIVANSQMSKLSTVGGTFQIVTDDTTAATATAVTAGDIAFTQTGSFPFSPTLAYSWHVVTTGDTAVAGSALRLNDEPQRPGWVWKLFLAPADPPTTGTFPATDDQGKPDFFVVAKSSATAANNVGFGVSIPQAADIVLTGGAFAMGLPFAPMVHIDNTPFSVTAEQTFPPAAGPGNTVPPDARPHVTFNKQQNPETITATTVLLQKNGTGANLCTIPHQQFPGGVDCVPATPLETGSSYTLTLTTGVTDMGGAALAANFTRVFTTATGSGGGGAGAGATFSPPSIISNSTVPQQGSLHPSNLPVSVTFTQDMKTAIDDTASVLFPGNSTLPANVFLVQDVNGATAVPGALVYANKVLKFTPTVQLTAGNSYKFIVKNTVKSNGGICLGQSPTGCAPDFVLRFPVGQMNTTALAVGTARPANNEVGVTPNQTIQLGFNNLMDATTFNSNTVRLHKTSHVFGTSAANGNLYSGTLNLALGDIVFRKPASGNHGWALVTTANGVGTNPGLNGAVAAAVAGSSVATKITPSAAGTTTGANPAVSSIALNEGDVALYSADGTGTNYRWGLITTSSGAAAAYTVNGAQVNGTTGGTNAGRVSKLVPTDFGAVTDGAKTVFPGDLIFTSTTQNPFGSTYDWHVVTSTTPQAINNTNLRLDGSSSAPVFATSAKFARFAPVYQSPVSSLNHSLNAGDLVFGYSTASPSSAGYSWHVVSTGSDKPGADALRLDGSGAKPTYALNTLLSNFTSSTGSINYDSGTKSVKFAPQFPLPLNTQYMFHVSSGATGVKDLIGGQLGADSMTSFTTAATFTAVAPRLQFVNVDTNSIVVEFTDQMKDDSSANGVKNISNYTLESPVGTDITATALAGKTVSYDPGQKKATITGLALTADATYKLTVSTNIQSAFPPHSGVDTTNNEFGQPRNAVPGKIISAALTGGFAGGGDFKGPGTEMQRALSPVMAFPRNMTASAVTNYEIGFKASQAIPASGVIKVVFPAGTTITNAAKATKEGTESNSNDDINGPGAGLVVFGAAAEDPQSGGANNDGVSIDTTNSDQPTVSVKLGAVGIAVNDYVRFELKNIGNPSIANDPTTSSGYSLKIYSYNTTGTVLDSLTSDSFFVSGCGPRTISGRVIKADTTGLNGARIGAFHYRMGRGEMVTTANNAAGGGLDGEYLISCLPADEGFDVGIDPSSLGAIAEQPPSIEKVSTLTGNAVKNFSLVSAPRTITVNITGGPLNKQVDVGAFGLGTMGFVLRTITLDGTGAGIALLRVNNNTNWSVNVMPYMPKDPDNFTGQPPKFEFLPPPPTEVAVATADPAALTVTLSSLDRTVSGKVVDEAGVGIQNVFVVLRPSDTSKGMQLNGVTGSDGTFSISTGNGKYIVEAFKPGFPSAQARSVEINATAQIPDANGLVIKLAQSSSTVTLTGRVTDGTNGIPNASIWAEQLASETDPRPIGNFRNADTDTTGEYKLYPDAGVWRIHADSKGKGYLGSKIKTVGTTAVTVDDFVATAPFTLTGRITIGGVNVKDADIWAFNPFGMGGGNTKSDGTTGAGTNFKLELQSGVTYKIGVNIPDVGSLPEVEVLMDGNKTQNFDASATGNEVTVNVTTGIAAITDAFVDVRNFTNRKGAGTSTSTVSGANGVYKVKVEPGTYTVFVGSPRGPIGSASVDVTAGPQTVTITRGTEKTISGTIRSAGVALGQAWVQVTGTSTTNSRTVNIGVFSADNGTYSISVPAGTYKLVAMKENYLDTVAPSAITVTTADLINQDRSLSLVTSGVDARTISGTVTKSDSTKFSSGYIGAYNTVTNQAIIATVNTDGTYTLNVGPGSWRVRAKTDGYESIESIVDTTSGNQIKNVTVSPITGFTVRSPKAASFAPNIGGVHTDPNIGTNFKVVLGANSLGSTADAATLSTKYTTSLPDTGTMRPLGGKGITISATSSEGQPITSLGSKATVQIPYTIADIPAGKTESDLVAGKFDKTINEWKILSCTQDTTNDFFNCTTDTFSDFAPLVSSSSIPTPTNLTATASSTTTVGLSWTAVSGATGYNVYRSTTSTGTFSRLGSEPTVSSGATTTYSDTGLNSGATYFYKLSSKDASGESASTAAISVTTLTAATAAAAGVSASSGGSSGGSSLLTATPAATPASTPAPSPSPTPSPTPAPTPSASAQGSGVTAGQKATSTSTGMSQTTSEQTVQVGEEPKVAPAVAKKLVTVKTLPKVGVKNAQVTTLQTVFKAEGLLENVSGKMDKATIQALMKFQEDHNIIKKGKKGYGKLGLVTQKAINKVVTALKKEAAAFEKKQKESEAAAKAESSTMASLEELKPLPRSGSLKIGAKGAQVTTLQAVLKADGLLKKSSGEMDTATIKALMKFQVKYGIAKQGKTGYGNLGPATRAKINAKIAGK